MGVNRVDWRGGSTIIELA